MDTLASLMVPLYGRHMPSTVPRPVRISAGSNRVDVVAKRNTEFSLDGSAEVTDADGRITVGDVRSRLAVNVPVGTDVVIGTTSGRVQVKGPVGHLAVVTESGKVEVESAAAVDIRTASSRVEVGEVAGVCRIRSTSGKVEVESCGDADVAGRSGRIELQRVDGEVEAHSVSGRIELSMSSANDIHAETVTGKIEVSLPKGTVPFRPSDSEHGALRPPGADCTVFARSTTGKVVVTAR